MKQTKYTGVFVNAEGHTYSLEVNSFSFIESFFLLTADAIRAGKHYQLKTITDETDNVRKIGDILQVSNLFSN